MSTVEEIERLEGEITKIKLSISNYKKRHEMDLVALTKLENKLLRAYRDFAIAVVNKNARDTE